jgi:large subunit ribosomal protein L2
MGRRILVRRRGRGGQQFRSQDHWKLGPVRHPQQLADVNAVEEGTIMDFVHETGRGVPLAIVKMDSGKELLWLPCEGMFVGDRIQYGYKTDVHIGNTMAIENIPEGTLIYNAEILPGDGGKLVRASGGYATIMTATERGVVVTLPSGKRVTFHQKSRATVGVVAAGGKINRPFVKAGTKHYYAKVRTLIWPKAKASKMNACSHPFGGGRKKRPGGPTTTSRNAPPGRKVGLIAARRTGLKKK